MYIILQQSVPLSAGCEAEDALGVLCKAAQQTAGIEQTFAP